MKIVFIFSCSGMFRNVPECSGMFHVPGFIDARHSRARNLIKSAAFNKCMAQVSAKIIQCRQRKRHIIKVCVLSRLHC